MDHAEAEWRLADLARGLLPDAEADEVEAHVANCPRCTRAWSRLLTMDMLGHIDLPVELPGEDRVVPLRPRVLVAGGGLLAVAVALLLFVLPTPRSPGTSRGTGGPSPVHLALAVGVRPAGDGPLERLSRGATYPVGSRIVLRVSADSPTRSYAWWRVGASLRALGAVDAGPEGALLPGEDGFSAEDVGTYELFVSPDGFGECAAGCVTERVEVR